jgi:hypothetical protein
VWHNDNFPGGGAFDAIAVNTRLRDHCFSGSVLDMLFFSAKFVEIEKQI